MKVPSVEIESRYSIFVSVIPFDVIVDRYLSLQSVTIFVFDVLMFKPLSSKAEVASYNDHRHWFL